MKFQKGQIPWNKKGKVKLICIHCGKSYLAYPFQVKNNRKFCSRLCARRYQGKRFSILYRGKGNPSWKGGISRPHIVLESVRIHGYNCQNCGTDKLIDTHHIDENFLNNPEDGSNWRRLCKKCHMSYHPSRHLSGNRT